MAALVALLSLPFSYFTYLRPVRALPLDAGEVAVSARVEEVLFESSYAFSCYASLEEIDGRAAAGRVLVEGDFGAALSRGMGIRFYASLSPLEGESAIYRKADGCIAVADELRELSFSENAPSLRERALDTLEGWRQALSAHLAGAVPGEGGQLLSAMLLGERDALAADTVRDFRRLGISHILSISGLHLQILIYLFNSLLSRTPLKRRHVLVLSMAAILFYVALIGFTPSAMRAGLMAVFLSLSFLVREQSDSLTSLFFAAVVITLLFPFTVYDVGFLLSCFATFGILLSGELRGGEERPRSPLFRAARPLLSAALITLSASLATLPITALFFGELSLFSLLSNLTLTPLFSLYLALAPISLILAPIPPIGRALSLLGEWLLRAVSAAADLPHILIDVAFSDFVLLALLFACVFFLLLCVAKRRRTLAAAGGAMLLLLAVCLSYHSVALLTRTEAHYENTANNEYLLLLDGEKSLLCDATNGASRAAREAQSLLRSAHLCELDGYLLTHYHARHPGMLTRLFGAVKVRALYLPAPATEKETEIYDSCVAVAKEHGVRVIPYDSQEPIPFASMTLTAHGQSDTASTHPAFSLSVARGEVLLTYLSAGMAESEGASAAAKTVEESTALIFGAHGPYEENYIAYPDFHPALSAVVISEPKERLYPSLYDALEELGLILEDSRVILPLG